MKRQEAIDWAHKQSEVAGKEWVVVLQVSEPLDDPRDSYIAIGLEGVGVLGFNLLVCYSTARGELDTADAEIRYIMEIDDANVEYARLEREEQEKDGRQYSDIEIENLWQELRG